VVTDGCAPPPAHIRQVRGRYGLKGFSGAGSSRTPLRHACRTRTVWQCQYAQALSGLLPPSPAPPGSGCPHFASLLRQGRRRRSRTSARIVSASRRTGWKPQPIFHVGAAPSLSELEVTRVASMSMISQPVSALPATASQGGRPLDQLPGMLPGPGPCPGDPVQHPRSPGQVEGMADRRPARGGSQNRGQVREQGDVAHGRRAQRDRDGQRREHRPPVQQRRAALPQQAADTSAVRPSWSQALWSRAAPPWPTMPFPSAVTFGAWSHPLSCMAKSAPGSRIARCGSPQSPKTRALFAVKALPIRDPERGPHP
jgi:hypothetical protein